MQLTIKYDNSREGLFFIPMEHKAINFTVHDSANRQLVQLTDGELKAKFGITSDELHSTDNVLHDDDFIRVPILLLPSSSEFEILTVTFVSPLDPKKYSKSRSMSMTLKFGIRISPYEFAIKSPRYTIVEGPYDLHVEIKTSNDYKIGHDYQISVEPEGSSKIVMPSKLVPNIARFYVSNMDFNSDFKGRISIGIADSTINTAAAIALAGILIPALLIGGQLLAGRLFVPTLELLGGVIAVLIGSRVWVIEDKHIMKRWVGAYHVIIGLNAVAFTIWFLTWLLGDIKTF